MGYPYFRKHPYLTFRFRPNGFSALQTFVAQARSFGLDWKVDGLCIAWCLALKPQQKFEMGKMAGNIKGLCQNERIFIEARNANCVFFFFGCLICVDVLGAITETV